MVPVMGPFSGARHWVWCSFLFGLLQKQTLRPRSENASFGNDFINKGEGKWDKEKKKNKDNEMGIDKQVTTECSRDSV